LVLAAHTQEAQTVPSIKCSSFVYPSLVGYFAQPTFVPVNTNFIADVLSITIKEYGDVFDTVPLL